MRALNKNKPVDPRSVKRYLEQKFGENLNAARSAMQELAGSMNQESFLERPTRFTKSFVQRSRKAPVDGALKATWILRKLKRYRSSYLIEVKDRRRSCRLDFSCSVG